MTDSRASLPGTSARLAAALAGRYRIERELGAGGMATVWLAQDLKHDRKVAIKVLHPHLAAVVGAERFLKEIKTTANLQHPHILALHDSGDADGLLFYVMPFVGGESLRQRITRDKQLPIADAVRITSEVASALDYAHRQGVIHRDIKPENILLHDGQALVADFGIALAPSAGGSRLTETGMSMGTPLYMSPEQALGERQLDARSDIYAVGAMLYEMLTGAPPFTGPSAQAIVAKVITEKPVPPSRLRREIPAYVEDAVLTALQKEPANRFATAGALQSALVGDPAPRVRRSISKRYGMWGIGAGCVLVIGALTMRTWQSGHHAASRPPPDSTAKRLVQEAEYQAKSRDPAHCKMAIAKFVQATEKDSTYAAAWGGLAKTHALCALFGPVDRDPAVEFADAKTASDKAISLDPTSWEAYTTRGMVHLFHEQDFADAQHDFTTAIRFDSTAYEPWLYRSWYYLAMNEIDSAEKSVRHAKELAPTVAPVVRVRLATVLRFNNKLPEAESEVAQVLQTESGNIVAHGEQFEIDIATGRCDSAASVLGSAPLAATQYNRALVAYYWAMCGQAPLAQHFVDSIAKQGPGNYVDHFALAMVYAALRDSNKVFEALNQAVTEHNWALFFLRWHYAFVNYRDTPEFLALMKRANVK
jgi:tetratricopeptide (TPR) repeat protein